MKLPGSTPIPWRNQPKPINISRTPRTANTVLIVFLLRSFLGGGSFLDTRARENAGERVVALMTRVLIQLTLGPLQTDHERPRPRPRRSVVDRQLPVDVVLADPRVAFGETDIRRRRSAE